MSPFRVAIGETAVHAAADAHRESLKAAVWFGFMTGRRAINKVALHHALDTGDKAAMRDVMAKIPGYVEMALRAVVPSALARTALDGVMAGKEMIPATARAAAGKKAVPPPELTIDTQFRTVTPQAVAWAHAHGAKLVKDLADTTKQDIAEAIAASLDTEITRQEAFDDILDAVGSEDRADLIARTETMRAANAGLAQSWDEAVDDGLLSEDAQKEWIATGDDRICDICEGLDGEVVGVNEDFSVGDDPPAHPACRCTMGIVG